MTVCEPAGKLLICLLTNLVWRVIQPLFSDIFFYLLRKLMLFKLSCYLTPVKALKCASSAITCPSFMPKAIAKPECFSGQGRLWMTVTRKPPGRNWLRSACSYSCRWQTGLFNCSRKVDPEQGGASCQHPSQRSE